MRAVILAAIFAVAPACGDDGGNPDNIDASASIDATDDDAGIAADAAADAAVGVLCGSATCDTTQECCVGAGDSVCVAEGTCTTTTIGCDGPEDCGVGETCCGGSAGTGTTCTAESSCQVVVCHTADDCPGADDLCCQIGAGDTSFCRSTACPN